MFNQLKSKINHPPEGQRQYEWRYADGRRYGNPEYAKNACTFLLSACRGGGVQNGGNGLTLYIHVTLTGERVPILSKDGWAQIPDGQWFNIDSH